jgi:hypothetical protein
MSRGIILKMSGILVLLILILYKGFPQNSDSLSLRLMFYNVENLFDIYDDIHRDDNDFMPDGLMRWNLTRYKKKVNSVYQTIVASGDWNTPAIIGFCEVENRSVLEDLIMGTYLAKYNFGIIHEESPDIRGIDVCLIYRKDLVRFLKYQYLIPSDIKREDYSTRSVLYSKFMIFEDTVHLFVNHWPSRRGGVLAGEEFRKSISEMIREKTDSISEKANGKAKVIIAGDFNCTPDDQEILTLTMSDITRANSKNNPLINLSEHLAGNGIGSYRFRGTWEMLDQVIVTEYLVNCEKGIYTREDFFRIFKPDFLLRKDPGYPGYSPFPTYLGYRYLGGFSDHLPVLLDLKLRKVK